jgi:hypothetical protein
MNQTSIAKKSYAYSAYYDTTSLVIRQNITLFNYEQNPNTVLSAIFYPNSGFDRNT